MRRMKTKNPAGFNPPYKTGFSPFIPCAPPSNGEYPKG